MFKKLFKCKHDYKIAEDERDENIMAPRRVRTCRKCGKADQQYGDIDREGKVIWWADKYWMPVKEGK